MLVSPLTLLPALLAVSLPPAQASSAPAQGATTSLSRSGGLQDPDSTEAVVEVLERAERRAGGGPGELAQELLDLGPEAFGEVFAILAEERLPRTSAEAEDEPRGLTFVQKTTLRVAISEAPREWIEDQVHAASRGRRPAAHRRLAIQLLSGALEADRLQVLVRLGEPSVPPDTRGELGVRKAFEQALHALLEESPQTLEQFPLAAKEAHPTLIAPLARAAGSHVDPLSLEALTRMLGRVPEADAYLLAQLGRVGEQLPQPIPSQIRREVRDRLAAADVDVVHEAIVTCGKLQDTEAAGTLVGLLDPSHPRLARSADLALREIVGHRVGNGPEAWPGWYATELAWWTNDAQLQLRVVSIAEPLEVAEILRELVQHRLWRHEITRPLTGVLSRPEADLVVVACATLGHLGSPLAVPSLVECLDHKDEKIQRAGHRALIKLTGLRIEPQGAAWREALQ